MFRKIATGILAGLVALAIGAGVASYVSPAPQASADVRIEVSSTSGGGVGSGVQIAPGFVLTNNHVVCDGVDKIRVVDRNSVGYEATVLWCNRDYDLAALSFNNANGKVGVRRLDCREPTVGEAIRSVGNPAGLEFVTMRGRVAAPAQALPPKWQSVLLVDMTMISGMSGGAAYGADGRVVGINAGVLPSGNSPGLPGQGGLSLIIPASIVCMLTGRA